MQTGTDRMIARKDGAVGWMFFNNPARHNAVSLEMWRAIPPLMEDFAADPAVRVIVVAGAGDRAFASGADISEFEERRATAEAIWEYDAISEGAYQALQETTMPSIAMIRGYCIGGGLDIALRCDVRIAAEDARFGIPAARLGIGYSFADMKRLTDVTGPAFAKEIFFTARQFSVTEARRMGLINRVVTVDTLHGAVLEYAGLIAGNAPLSVAAAKRCIGEAVKDPERRDVAGCHAAVDACFGSADYAEGRTAFMEKRPPAFRGL